MTFGRIRHIDFFVGRRCAKFSVYHKKCSSIDQVIKSAHLIPYLEVTIRPHHPKKVTSRISSDFKYSNCITWAKRPPFQVLLWHEIEALEVPEKNGRPCFVHEILITRKLGHFLRLWKLESKDGILFILLGWDPKLQRLIAIYKNPRPNRWIFAGWPWPACPFKKELTIFSPPQHVQLLQHHWVVNISLHYINTFYLLRLLAFLPTGENLVS